MNNLAIEGRREDRLREFQLFSVGRRDVRNLIGIIRFRQGHRCFELHTISTHLKRRIRSLSKERLFYIQRFQRTTTFEKQFLSEIVFAEESGEMSRDEILVFHVLRTETCSDETSSDQSNFDFFQCHDHARMSNLSKDFDR